MSSALGCVFLSILAGGMWGTRQRACEHAAVQAKQVAYSTQEPTASTATGAVLTEPIWSSQTVDILRNGNRLQLKFKTQPAGEVKIPRFFAALRTAEWSEGGAVMLQPETDHWLVKWKQQPEGQPTIELEFDSIPWMAEEWKGTTPVGDGSVVLPAHAGVTQGEKLRYEPQPFKNTIGYWVNPQDHVQWEVRDIADGEYDVWVLQGCGKGQGGSQARFDFQSEGQNLTLDFTTVETGHFQNFQWCQVGRLSLKQRGDLEVRITADSIKNAALFDVRMVHLIRKATP